MASSAKPHPALATVPTSRLRAGVTLRSPVYEIRDGRSVLLLAAGVSISDPLIVRLKQRGISRILMQTSELARMANDGEVGSPDESSGLPDLRVRGGRRFAVSSDSYCHRVRRHGASTYRAENRRNFVDSYEHSMAHVEGLFGELSAGIRVDGRMLNDAANDSLDRMARDVDLFVSLGIVPEADQYPVRHSLQTSILATAIGSTVGLGEKDLLDLGIGCLIHDAGMLHIESELYEAERVLDDIEFLEITKHPTIAFDLIRGVRELSTGARMVVYQMHERCNATGYPRRRDARSIHPLAKIAAVADAFVALISPRPHRPGMIPYRAIEQMVQDAHRGLFDPDIVRGLLHTVSLFPIGSFVELSDGRTARVIRANGEKFTRPVVELGGSDALVGATEVVDLAADDSLHILRPLMEPEPVPAATDASEDPRPASDPPEAAADHWE
ncbi:MAG: HD domain-containing phosphohydrolase [Planctomycetaceae bacterium]